MIAHMPQKQDGFALVAAVLIVAVMSVAALPLLNLVGGTQESNVKNQVSSFLNTEAREHLELMIYLAKFEGGLPGYMGQTHTPDTLEMARACGRRINAADSAILGSANVLVTLNDARYSPISSINGRNTIGFVVDKGKAAVQNDSGDDRYQRFAVVSCSIADGYGMSVYTGEIANIKGSFYTLNLNEY